MTGAGPRGGPAGPAEYAALGLAGLAAALVLPGWLAVGLAGLLHTGRWTSLPAAALARLLAGWSTHLANPAAALPGAAGRPLAPAGLLDGCALAAVIAEAAAAAVAARPGLGRARRDAGLAGRAEIRAHTCPPGPSWPAAGTPAPGCPGRAIRGRSGCAWAGTPPAASRCGGAWRTPSSTWARRGPARGCTW